METMYTRGCIIGKLFPPHAGHLHLIRTALAQCKTLDLFFTYTDPSERPPPHLRLEWLSSIFAPELAAGRLRLGCKHDTYDQDDSQLWAQLALDWLREVDDASKTNEGYGPLDAVFTSEAYGDPYSRYLTTLSGRKVHHVSVDRNRVTYPVSGTLVRTRPLHPSLWRADPPDLLDVRVRTYYVLRVVLVGAESAGKTTLAQALARRFETDWVPEAGRDVTQEKLDQGDIASVPVQDTDVGAAAAPTAAWRSADFLDIARLQSLAEEAAAVKAATNRRQVLICDTDALATVVWHERYMMAPHGTPDVDTPAIAQELEAHVNDELNSRRGNVLYVVPSPEGVPLVQDGTRDGDDAVREWMHARFMAVLAQRGERYVEIVAPVSDGGGGWGVREALAVSAVEAEVERLSN
ncbi:AAA domain-containing protein [Blastocladiella britannica]|nr:AAA domain-containing protein [Blastocladiella britannica]